jgi:putative tryptophan/tyrosine transport system substrate-binding protein
MVGVVLGSGKKPMKRRDFITLIGGAAAAWPLAARAQQGERVHRIGALIAGSGENDPESRARVAALREGLAQRGWIDGRNLRIDYRWAGTDPDRIRAFAAELVATVPEAIFAHSTPASTGVLLATRSIPIVFASVSDPVGDGIVAGFARPGGNVTGFTNVEASMGGKWVEILKELAPSIIRVGFLFNPTTAPGGGSYFLRPFEAAAPSFNVQPIATPVEDVAGIEHALALLAAGANGGLIVNSDIFTARNRAAIIAAAARHRLPAIYPFSFFVASGGLVAYGSDITDLWRRAASYLDRILRGEKPSDLPVQAPVKFELVINLKTAKALGLDVPLQLQQRADEVIE